MFKARISFCSNPSEVERFDGEFPSELESSGNVVVDSEDRYIEIIERMQEMGLSMGTVFVDIECDEFPERVHQANIEAEIEGNVVW